MDDGKLEANYYDDVVEVIIEWWITKNMIKRILLFKLRNKFG